MNGPLSPMPSRFFGAALIRAFALLLLLAGAFLQGCSNQETVRFKPPVPVKTAQAATQDVPITLSAVGTVEAYKSVNVIPRVSGRIISVAVTEGRMVAKGDLLFTIDDAAYQTDLASAKATLEGNLIRLEKAKKDADRYAALLAKDYVTRDQAEQTQATAKALETVVAGNDAAFEAAKLNLSYCRVTASIPGRAGAVLLHEGNMVKENDLATPLMVIHQVSPIFVRFSVPEQNFTDIPGTHG